MFFAIRGKGEFLCAEKRPVVENEKMNQLSRMNT